MRATISGLPVGIRMMLGLMSVALFLFLGLSFLEENRTLAWVFLAFAIFRSVIWLRVLGRLLARRAAERNQAGPPEPVTRAPSPEELLAEEDARAEDS